MRLMMMTGNNTTNRSTASDAQPVALRCSGLIKRYPDVTAVNGIDLEVRTGECFGLLGPNGAGKTTTVEIFEGLTKLMAARSRCWALIGIRGRTALCVIVLACSYRKHSSLKN